jgi:hypothetical protein
MGVGGIRSAAISGTAKLPLRLIVPDCSEDVSSATAPVPTANSQERYNVNGAPMPIVPTMASPATTLTCNGGWNVMPNLLLAFDAAELSNNKRACSRCSDEAQ